MTSPAMGIEVRPATVFRRRPRLVGPKRPDANVCWCLSYRIPSKGRTTPLRSRPWGRVEELLAEGPLTGDGLRRRRAGRLAAAAPRATTTSPATARSPTSTTCPCGRCGASGAARAPRQGISHAPVTGAVDWARAQGAPALEAYLLGQQGARVDLDDGLRRDPRDLPGAAGFRYAADTTSVLAGTPRVVPRHDPA